MIRLRPIVYLLSFIAVIEAAFMAIPWIVGIALGDDTVLAFGVTIAALLAIGIPFIVKKPVDPHLSPKGGFLIAALSWVVLSVFGALPFVISGYIPDFIDALFETVSGFTTTGASIVSNVEALPKSLLLWRSLTHWIGGMGILVFIIAILPRFDNRIIHVFRAESPGPQVGKLVSKLRFTARILYGIYIVMTVIEIALLSVEMSFFDAVIHSFGTAGTGGFSSRNASVAAFDSAYVDGVITVFMFLFGINFNIFYFVLIGTICGLVGTMFTGGFTMPTMVAAAAIAGFVICSTCAQFFLTRAFSRGNLVLSGALQYTVILFSTLMGVFIFGDSVSTAVIGGMVMIVVAGILASYFTRQEKQKAIEEAKHTHEGLQRHLRHKEARDH